MTFLSLIIFKKWSEGLILLYNQEEFYSFQGYPTEYIVTCLFTATLWEKLVIWCNNINIKVRSLSAADIIFGDWQRKEDFLLLNHIILIAKRYIYYCRINNSKPFFNVLKVRIKSVYLLEYQISKRKNKRQAHSLKWHKCCFEEK